MAFLPISLILVTLASFIMVLPTIFFRTAQPSLSFGGAALGMALACLAPELLIVFKTSREVGIPTFMAIGQLGSMSSLSAYLLPLVLFFLPAVHQQPWLKQIVLITVASSVLCIVGLLLSTSIPSGPMILGIAALGLVLLLKTTRKAEPEPSTKLAKWNIHANFPIAFLIGVVCWAFGGYLLYFSSDMFVNELSNLMSHLGVGGRTSGLIIVLFLGPYFPAFLCLTWLLVLKFPWNGFVYVLTTLVCSNLIATGLILTLGGTMELDSNSQWDFIFALFTTLGLSSLTLFRNKTAFRVIGLILVSSYFAFYFSIL